VDLPGRGSSPSDLDSVSIADFIASVVGTIVDERLTDVTLVGHSMAGLTLPGVAEAIADRLRQLVFVSCAVPPHGTPLADVLGTFSPGAAAIAERVGGEVVDSQGVLHPDLATALFCNDMNPEQTASTLRRLVPEAFGVLFEPSDLTGLRHAIPRTYVRLTQDAVLSLDTQDRMIDNLGSTEVVDLDAGHMAMISRPLDLAGILNRL
jgi:pimeloyl-ACP methyl ester carboxylesterase